MVEYVVKTPSRTFTFQIFAGYAALEVWNGPEVLCQGGHLKVGSALLAKPETLKAVADKWLDQHLTRVNSNVKGKRKK